MGSDNLIDISVTTTHTFPVLPYYWWMQAPIYSVSYGQGTENSLLNLQQKLKNVGHQFGDLGSDTRGKISFSCVASSVCTCWEEAWNHPGGERER